MIVLGYDGLSYDVREGVLSRSKLAGVAEAAKARADLFDAHRRAERDAREALLFAVSMERDLGTPWAEIEKAAGITRQAIHALGR